MEKRIMIIGIDGAPYGLIKTLCKKDHMPTLKDLGKENRLVEMRSSIPDVSSVSWSSIITGTNPGQHGIYGFTHLIDGTYTISFPNFNNLKVKAFWDGNRNRKHVIINVPFTYPAKPLNGVLISGFVALDLQRAVYPPEHLDYLQQIGYKVDVDVEKVQKSGRLLFKELDRVFERRKKVCNYFLDKKWNVFVFVVTESDRLEHFLWDAYEDSGHGFHQTFIDFFKKVDETIGTLVSKLDERDDLIILSDHGMERVKVSVNLNTFLQREGILYLEESPQKKLNAIKEGTKAFVLDPGRVYLNFRGKYPRGSLDVREKEGILTELEEAFFSLRYNGENVIEKIYRKEEIYFGEYTDTAPDLVLSPTFGYQLKAGLFEKEIFKPDPLAGKHNPEAFLLVKGEGENRIPKNVSVENILSIAALGG